MKLSRILGLAVLMLLVCTTAYADSLTFTGTTANGEYGPYSLILNGTPTQGICYSAANWISSGETWSVQAYNINQVKDIKGAFAGTTQEYNELGYLASELFANTNPSNGADLQIAIWTVLGLSDPFGPTAGSAKYLQGAINATSGPNGYGPNGYVTSYLFYIPTGPNLPTVNGTTPQPFIVATPEPGSLAMMVCGVLVLALLAIFRTRVAA